MLKHAGVEFQWTDVNTIEPEQASDQFKAVSPNNYVPVLKSGDSIVLLSGNELYAWVLKQEKKVGELLDRADQEQRIKAMQRYFFKEMQTSSQQLIKRTVLHKTDPEIAAKLTEPHFVKRFAVNFYEYEVQVLKRFN